MKQVLLTLTLFVSGLFTTQLQAQTTPERLYVGTYSTRGSEGIYTFTFDRKTGKLTPAGATSNDKSPSFLALHPSKRFLYSVNESSEGANGVSAYAIDAKTGALTLLNLASSEGGGPCHISIDKTGRLAFISAYGGGTFAALPIQADGRVEAATFKKKFEGGTPANDRQTVPHIHSATVSPDNRFVYVADLGTDRVYCYAIDAKNQRVTPAATPFITVKSGSGPRHMAMHPSGKFAYLVEEMTSSTAVFSRDAKTGALMLIQDRVATLPADDKTANNTSADIHMDPTGTFVYQSNRGQDALAILTVAADGKLTRMGSIPTGGKTPRNFWVDPRGQFVIVANQATDNLVVFRRDAKGQLTPTGQSISVPAPVCIISGN